MGFRFRRSISLIPGVRINLGGRRGPSVTVGGRGMSVNVGPAGTHLNAGIPGTGVSYREKLDSGIQADRPALPPQSFTTGGTAWLVILLVGILVGAALFE